MYPDILGYNLPRAVEILNSKGYKFKIMPYLSPKGTSQFDEENARVVRIRALSDAILELVVC